MKQKLFEAKYTFYSRIGKMVVNFTQGKDSRHYTCTLNKQYMGSMVIKTLEPVTITRAREIGVRIIKDCKTQRIS